MPDHPSRADISPLDPAFRRDPFERPAWLREQGCPYRLGNFVLGFESMPVRFAPTANESV